MFLAPWKIIVWFGDINKRGQIPRTRLAALISICWPPSSAFGMSVLLPQSLKGQESSPLRTSTHRHLVHLAGGSAHSRCPVCACRHAAGCPSVPNSHRVASGVCSQKLPGGCISSFLSFSLFVFFLSSPLPPLPLPSFFLSSSSFFQKQIIASY